jgi:broad specificity phosphatase PhoE
VKTLYLLRHGAPEGAIGTGARCLGSTEAELSPQGRFQAALVGIWLEGQADAIWSSPLNRCRQTAHIAFGTYQVEPDLREIHMGAWDGMPFDTIRAKWPELYRKRGEDPIQVVPPGGEAPEEALARMERALLRIAQETEGTAAVVAHAGLLRLFLCKAEGRPLRDEFSLSQPYGCVNKLTWGKNGFQVWQKGLKPKPELDETACIRLLKAVGCKDALIAHCRKVAQVAVGMGKQLARAGTPVDTDCMLRGALLHDMARAQPNHAREGARWLREAGYEKEAEIVLRHHDWDGGAVDEAAVVYWADKRVMGDRVVTMEERFAQSARKCATQEAKEAHDRRRRIAVEIEAQLERQCGRKAEAQDGKERIGS